MLNYLLKVIIVAVSLIAIFELIERVRIATGKEMLTDKLLSHLEDVYQRTAPHDNQEMDFKECELPEKVEIFYYNYNKSK